MTARSVKLLDKINHPGTLKLCLNKNKTCNLIGGEAFFESTLQSEQENTMC